MNNNIRTKSTADKGTQTEPVAIRAIKSELAAEKAIKSEPAAAGAIKCEPAAVEATKSYIASSAAVADERKRNSQLQKEIHDLEKESQHITNSRESAQAKSEDLKKTPEGGRAQYEAHRARLDECGFKIEDDHTVVPKLDTLFVPEAVAEDSQALCSRWKSHVNKTAGLFTMWMTGHLLLLAGAQNPILEERLVLMHQVVDTEIKNIAIPDISTDKIPAMRAQGEVKRPQLSTDSEPNKRQKFDSASLNNGQAQSTASATNSVKFNSANKHLVPSTTTSTAKLERKKADLKRQILEQKEGLKNDTKAVDDFGKKIAAQKTHLATFEAIKTQSIGATIASIMADKCLDEFWEVLLMKELHTKRLELARRIPDFKNSTFVPHDNDLIEEMSAAVKAIEHEMAAPECGIFSFFPHASEDDRVVKAIFQHINDRLGQEVKKEAKNLIPDLPKSGF